MNLISTRLDIIKPSPSMAVAERAAMMRAAGTDVINLGIGEPDFPTPAHIVEAAYEAMKRGETRYTASSGTLALKKAVAAKFRRESSIEYDVGEIIIGAGAKQIIFNAMLASLEKGDEVIIPAPYWVSYSDMVLLGEGTPVVVECDRDSKFKLTAQALRAAITQRTKWLILNSPSNPSGAVYSSDELASLAQVLLEHPNVHILTDDIYEHIIFDGCSFNTIAAVEPRLRDRTLTVNGVSKAYCMTGWRIGYAGGPEPLIRAMATLQSQSTTNPCSISQAASIAALEGPQDFLAKHSLEFQIRRDRALELLHSIPGLSCETPQGAFYLYANCAPLIGRKTPQGNTLENDDDVSIYLLEHGRVAVVPGSAYGLSPYFRISIATSLQRIEDAFERMGTAISQLAPR